MKSITPILFPKPESFDSLAAFVKENYSDALDRATLSEVELDGRPAVTFWTVDQSSSREFNIILADNDATWVLLTTARLSFIRDVEASPAPAIAKTDSRSASRSAVILPLPFSTPCFTRANACNCVYFVKCLAPWMNPQRLDLTTFAAKKRMSGKSLKFEI